ncbi:ester cyclase [Haladaptatus caseinilyticus]|uniref:ester cyclase n=1 Tax=Haladaptatus caseinilyticus TaxID=2993314 RepID=UPI00224A9C61|nr:ester cyclase [Haladaptatus caseinilyticus]
MAEAERRPQANEEIVRRFIEESFDEEKSHLIDELLADDFVAYEPEQPEPIRGRDGYRRTVELYRSAFPDISFTIHDLVSEGDRVAVHWTASGTHDGELMGIEPTGKRVENEGMEFNYLRDGKIVEMRVVWDALGMLRQLDAMPDERSA